MKRTERDLAVLRYLKDVPSLPFSTASSPAQQLGAKAMIEKELSNAMDDNENLDIWITVGASKEIPFVRKAIEHLGGSSKRAQLTKTLAGYRCEVPSSDSSRIVTFALIAATGDGKTPQTNLVNRINDEGSPRILILVGMMGGLPKKINMLDVVIPKVIYDGTTIGSKDGKPYLTKSGRSTHERFASWSSNFVGEVAEEFGLTIKNTKNTVSVGAVIEDVTEAVFKTILELDEPEIVGMEMEGFAVLEASFAQQMGDKNVVMGFVKGVADYGQDALPDDQVAILRSAIPELRDIPNLTPRGDDKHRRLIQEKATVNAFSCAIRLAEFGMDTLKSGAAM